jgi:dCTP deaminase
MSILGRNRIIAALSETDLAERLFITPILDQAQISNSSFDVRLGFEFVTIKRGNVGVFDPANEEITPERFRTPHHLNLKCPFYLHPNEMALASTLEHFRLPVSIGAYVTSRSKWGRRGLIIATATAVNPGFSGTITLELVNHGNVPLVLYPGLSVAQIIFHDAEGAVKYGGSLANQIGPLQSSVSGGARTDDAFWLPDKAPTASKAPNPRKSPE